MTVYFYALFVHLSLNVYIFLKGMRLLESQKVWRTIFASFFILEFTLYLTGLYFQSILPDPIVRIIWLMGSTWMVFIFYMTMLWLLIDLILYLNKRRPFLGEYLNIHPKKTGAVFFIITTISIATIMYMGNYRFRNPVVSELELTINKEAGDLHSLRIAVISDVHLGYLINKKYAKRYADLIVEQKPDIVLFVGDIIDAEIAPIIEQNMKEDFHRLNPPLGVYSCTGNHEYRYEANYKINWLNDQANIKMIRDSAVLINNSFYVVGREDCIITSRKKLKTILEEQDVDSSLPMIVLNHTPNDLDEEMEAGADIALYGHTHDGQIFPFNIFTRLVFEVSRGYKKKGDTHVYVSSGLGLSGPQYRIGTKSEIAMLNVTFTSSLEGL
ncbi:MAG TPA: metallophosphoesterase [Dysgonamonadaceae bacterium]|nr:metallophosphoesterase [Dysgonamonadaceae bacterium]